MIKTKIDYSTQQTILNSIMQMLLKWCSLLFYLLGQISEKVS